jgi:hypothetical protein
MTVHADTWLCHCGAIPLIHVLWDAETMKDGPLCAEHMRDLTSEGGSREFATYHIFSGHNCLPDGECWQPFLNARAERAQRLAAQ